MPVDSPPDSQRAHTAEEAAKLLGHTPTTWIPLWSAGSHTCSCDRCGATMILTKNKATGPILKFACNTLIPGPDANPPRKKI